MTADRCPHCRSPRHPRTQAAPAQPEPRMTWFRLLGLTVFAIGMWAVIIYSVLLAGGVA